MKRKDLALVAPKAGEKVEWRLSGDGSAELWIRRKKLRRTTEERLATLRLCPRSRGYAPPRWLGEIGDDEPLYAWRLEDGAARGLQALPLPYAKGEAERACFGMLGWSLPEHTAGRGVRG